MIDSYKQYKDYIRCDSINYKEVSGSDGFFSWLNKRLYSTPISDQVYIWHYIKCLRFCEYLINTRKKTVVGGAKFLLYIVYLHRLRHLARKTGFQIPPNTIGRGLTIWHWGPIIVNGNVRIGDNCVLRPDIVIGHKYENGSAPQIGNNVEINSGSRIIGNDIEIGDDVIIAPGAIVTKSIPAHSMVAGVPAKIIKTRLSENSQWERC